jgi:hypothetical protein
MLMKKYSKSSTGIIVNDDEDGIDGQGDEKW